MSPTLLEFAVAIVLVIVLWQIGVIIAPSVLGWLGRLGRDIDHAADKAVRDETDPQAEAYQQHSKEHGNGTHR